MPSQADPKGLGFYLIFGSWLREPTERWLRKFVSLSAETNK